MNESLEKLIDLALADGVLTDKEKEVLQRKANELGVDQDEFEMVLDAKIHLMQKESASAAPPPPAPTPPPAASAPAAPAPESNKQGHMKKCPSCGAPAEPMATSCGSCGHHYSGLESVGSVTKLHEDLQRIEREEREEKRPGALGGLMDKFDGGNSSDQQIDERIKKRKASLISSFPVPNTKEDILEFLALAVPEAGKKPNVFMRMTASGTLYKAWVGKAEQVVMKARFSMKDDKVTLNEIEMYAQKLGIK